MDFNLKQWRDQQHESEEEQPSAKIPRQLLLESPHQQEISALPLFVSEPNNNKINSHLSIYSDHSSSSPPSLFSSNTPRFPRVGGGGYCFSITQWQELELQALIFRHMMAGAAVPQELLQLVKKSLLTSSSSSSSPYYLHHYPPHFQSAALLQAGYWGKGAMDPEPGRCRRTDGKKWRCSRDVVAGHKYCERHMHRGRNRSRKPVEFPPSGGASGGGGGGGLVNKSTSFGGGSIGGIGGGGDATPFSITGAGGSSLDAFQLNHGSDKKVLFESQHDSSSGDGKSNDKVLMHLFDDWPRSLQEQSDNSNLETNGHSPSGTNLSMSTNGNPTSDFLRLSTGNIDDLGRRNEGERDEASWTNRWGSNPVGSMGGPLAEALRSSTNLSPTSVLHQLPRCSTSDTSYVTA